MLKRLRNSTFYRDTRPGLRRYAAKRGMLAYFGRAERNRALYAEARLRPIRENTVFYEAYAGRGILCNPGAIFDALISDENFAHLSHIWTVADPRVQDQLREKYRRNRRVKIVGFKTTEYFDHLARAQYLVNNVTFPSEFNKRPEQIYLNTWHGTPLKAMGLQVPNGEKLSRNVVRNFLHADFLLSSGEQMTDHMYRKAYKLDGLFQGAVIEAGAPRVAAQLEVAASGVDSKREVLRAAGVVVPENHKVVLYAPTWRGAATFRPQDQSDELVNAVELLNQATNPHGITVVLKAHQLAYRFMQGVDGVDGLLVDDQADTNAVLGAVDGLITDYSSIAFDFLATRAPLFWYTPDLDQYAATQGLIIDHADVYGTVLSDLPSLGDAIVSEFTGSVRMVERDAALWTQTVGQFAPHDAESIQPLLHRVFLNDADADTHEVSLLNDKTRILFYPGGLEPNGITSSAVNLLTALDPKRYDITVVRGGDDSRDRKIALEALPDHIRVISRVGAVAVPRKDAARWRSIYASDTAALFAGGNDERHIEAEASRMFGKSRFDTVIDFAGYTPFWQTILLHVPAACRIVWQHNDLLEELTKEVGGKRVHERNLHAVFSLYERWQTVVAVSSALEAVNRDKLAPFIGEVRTDFVPNLIDGPKILDAAADPAADINPADVLETSDCSSVSALLDHLESAIGTEALVRATTRAALRASAGIDVNAKPLFVSAGRFSPEKNHHRLLEAFAKVADAFPSARLVLCGQGPLLDSTRAEAAALGIADRVAFPGHTTELAYLMTLADAFVLSSDHEGQPVVILEALTLGTPVVTTAFDSVAGVPDSKAVTVVERDAGHLAAGMIDLASNARPAPDFDFASYNHEALERFERIVKGLGDATDGTELTPGV